MVVTLGAVAVALTVASCARHSSGDRGAPPAAPPSPPPAGRGGGDPPPSARPNEVAVERAVDLRPAPWARAERVPGERRVRVHATLSGGPPCAVLGRVDVDETATAVSVTLWVGRRPTASCGGPQPAIGFPIVVTVNLRSPLGQRSLRDGALQHSRRPRPEPPPHG
jgi:hypothetical protein